jgi:hypothetical protein
MSDPADPDRRLKTRFRFVVVLFVLVVNATAILAVLMNRRVESLNEEAEVRVAEVKRVLAEVGQLNERIRKLNDEAEALTHPAANDQSQSPGPKAAEQSP